MARPQAFSGNRNQAQAPSGTAGGRLLAQANAQIAARPGRGAPAAAAPARRPAAPAAPASVYAGVTTQGDRSPMLSPGQYRVRLDNYNDEKPPQKRGDAYGKSRVTVLEVIECPDGGIVADAEASIVEAITGEGAYFGLPKIKSMALAFAGFDGSQEGLSEADFDAMDPRALILQATAGYENEASAIGATLIGRTAYVTVTRGNDRPNGDYYRNYKWDSDPEQPDGLPEVLIVEGLN